MIKINDKECNCDEEVLKYIIKSNEEKEALEVKYTQALEVAQDRFERIQKTIAKIENLYDTNSTKQEIIYVNNLILNDILSILKGSNNEIR